MAREGVTRITADVPDEDVARLEKLAKSNGSNKTTALVRALRTSSLLTDAAANGARVEIVEKDGTRREIIMPWQMASQTHQTPNPTPRPHRRASRGGQSHPWTETISEKREDTRKLIAIWLLVGLALVSLAWAAVGVFGDEDAVTNAGDALDKIFTGILGLTGTAVGFYFGAGGTANDK
jgi:hypothetical protein